MGRFFHVIFAEMAQRIVPGLPCVKPALLSRIQADARKRSERRDAENAERRREFLLAIPSPDSVVGSQAHSAILCGLCASAFIPLVFHRICSVKPIPCAS